MFGWIKGKIYTVLFVVGTAAMAILYVLGLRQGRRLEEADHLEAQADLEKDKADFYRRMHEYEHDAEDYSYNRSKLVDRVRKHGL